MGCVDLDHRMSVTSLTKTPEDPEETRMEEEKGPTSPVFETTPPPPAKGTLLPFHEYMIQLRPILCRTENAIYINVHWYNPERYFIKKLYFTKLTSKASKYLSEGYAKKFTYATDDTPISGEPGRRPVFWKTSFADLEMGEVMVHAEPINRLPSLTFPF